MSARPYYGWTVLAVAAAAMVGTLPGRTQGLGLVTEPLLADLGLDRVGWAQINFWATLIGSGFALGIGRILDRAGARLVLTLTALALGVIVLAMSAASGLLAMAVLVTLTRGVGQSALSVISLTMVGQWFVRRVSLAMGVYSVVMSLGFMIAFPAVGALVQARGWRTAWAALGLALVAGLAPLAWWLVRRGPEALGLVPDGGAVTTAAIIDQTPAGWAWRDAVATPSFWVFALGSALYGLVASGIGLFNESILAERGFGPGVYYQTLVVTAMTALAGNFAGGWLASHWHMPWLMAIAMAILAAGLAVLPSVATVTQVMGWAVLMGLGGGVVMVLFFGFWPRAFGRRELGRIQGAAQALTVLASAVGPLLLAQWVAWTGSYASMFTLLAGVVSLNAVAALLVAMPVPDREISRFQDPKIARSADSQIGR
ncbi:MAG: MFS transporter [Vicinamibacterales bacterium]|nr:MFS transporter [Vicinamibacterales bacterium]